jgi:hypothetical protein
MCVSLGGCVRACVDVCEPGLIQPIHSCEPVLMHVNLQTSVRRSEARYIFEMEGLSGL